MQPSSKKGAERYFAAALFLCLISYSLALSPAAAETPRCEIERKIVFGGLDWDSNSFHNEVARYILEHGFGCKTDIIPGSTIPITAGAVRGDVDIVMEIWKNNTPQVWADGMKAGKVAEIGVNFPDAVQHWYVPRYLTEGKDAPAKDLKNVADLIKYKGLFSDPEEPDKGRFYNCISGWACEVVNSKKFAAYGLENHFVNFRPGTGAALSAAVESAIARRKPVVFYYWGPTWLLGKIGDKVVALEEPAYDEAKWKALNDAKTTAEVKEATAYPVVAVAIGVNSAFSAKAPQLVAFLSRYRTSNQLVSEALAYMQDHRGSAAEAAQHFLKTKPEVWKAWVPQDVASRIDTVLAVTAH